MTASPVDTTPPLGPASAARLSKEGLTVNGASYTVAASAKDEGFVKGIITFNGIRFNGAA